MILLSPKPQRKRTDTANVMDTTITKNDNSKTFRGHLKGLYCEIRNHSRRSERHQVAQLRFVARTFSWNIETEN